MGSMEDEDYLHSLSRRDLQDLCRKNGLPTNKTKSRLANMLVSYYQNKNVSSATLEERARSPMDGSPLPVLNVEPELNPIGEMNEEVHNVRVEADDVDGRRSPTCSNVAVSGLNVVPKVTSMNSTEVYGFSGFNIHETAGCSLLGHQCDNSTPMFKSKGKLDSDEPRDNTHNTMGPDGYTGLGNIPQIEGRDKCEVPTDTSFISFNASDMKSPRKFEIYAASENGINLTVDLDWNPSDWIKRLNDGVCVHPKVLNDKSVELNKELSTSGHDETETETEASLLDNTVIDSNNKGDLTFKNSLVDSIVKEGNQVKTKEPDRSSMTGIKQINTPAVTLGHMEETSPLNSSLCEPNFDVHNPTDMCNKSSFQTSEKHALSLAVPHTSQISTDNHGIGSKLAGTKSIDSMDSFSKNCNICPENIEIDSLGTSCIPDARRILSSCEVPEMMKTFTAVQAKSSEPFGGFPDNGVSMGNQLLQVEGSYQDMENSHNQNGESLDLNNSNHYLQKETVIHDKCELDLNKSLVLPSEGPEEQSQQRSNPTNEVESSECPPFDMKIGSNKRPCSSDSEGLQTNKKKQHSHNGGINHLPRRTSTRKVGPRRSMRLVSK